jgi:hypothetical protein
LVKGNETGNWRAIWDEFRNWVLLRERTLIGTRRNQRIRVNERH